MPFDPKRVFLRRLIHRLNGLDGQQQKSIQRARALTCRPAIATRANLVVKGQHIRINCIALHCVNRVHKVFQIQFDATAISQRCARRTTRRSFDAGVHTCSRISARYSSKSRSAFMDGLLSTSVLMQISRLLRFANCFYVILIN